MATATSSAAYGWEFASRQHPLDKNPSGSLLAAGAGSRNITPRFQEPAHRKLVIRALPVPPRHVGFRAQVQVVLLGPIAQPRHGIADGLPRGHRRERGGAGRVEQEAPVRSGADAPPPFVHQVMVEAALCRLPDYADFGGPRAIATAVAAWAGGIIRARSGRPAGGREAGSGVRPRGWGLSWPGHVPSRRGRLRDRRGWFRPTHARATGR